MKKAFTPLQQLQALHLEHLKRKHPTFPEHSLPKKRYGQKSANEITKAVIDFLTFSGHYVTRIQSQGQYRPGIGWTRGTTKKGTADVHAIINGRHFSIEVKAGKDKMSAEQKKSQQEVERAGGIWLTIKSFDEFYEYYTGFILRGGGA